MSLVPPHAIWNGEPERLSNAFGLTKTFGDEVLTATCEVWSHPRGWELRLVVDGQGLQMSLVVLTRDEFDATATKWRDAMIERGWA